MQQNTVVVDKAVALGEVQDTPDADGSPTETLAADLLEWRLASGRPGLCEPIFPLRRGGVWTEIAYRNWRRQIFNPAAKRVGIDRPRPYDLRHSFAAFLFAEGVNPAEIAEQTGHSLQTLLGTYTHVIEELPGQERRAADALILEARSDGTHGPRMAPKPPEDSDAGPSEATEHPHLQELR